jgi:hypothetical protein
MAWSAGTEQVEFAVRSCCQAISRHRQVNCVEDEAKVDSGIVTEKESWQASGIDAEWACWGLHPSSDGAWSATSRNIALPQSVVWRVTPGDSLCDGS